MNIAFYWMTMGAYHFARMQAIAALKATSSLKVWESTDLDDHEWVRQDSENGYSVASLFHREMLNNSLVGKAALRLRKRITEGKTDIFVNGAGYFHPLTLLPLLKLKRRQGSKIILWSESTSFDNEPSGFRSFVKKQLVKVYDGAIVAGPVHKEHLLELGMNENSIAVVGNVVDNAFFSTDKPASQRRGFLFVGRLLDIKNVARLIRAYASYRRKCEATAIEPEELVIVGDGPEGPNIRRMAKELRMNGIRLTGSLQVDQVKKEYDQAGAFILPSISEPWGLVVNEAMASGLPVLVSSKCGCAPDLVEEGKNGYIFDPLKEEEIAAAMYRISSEPDKRDAFGKHSLTVIERFSPAAYAERCGTFFESLLNG